jgi:hypothetical protein
MKPNYLENFPFSESNLNILEMFKANIQESNMTINGISPDLHNITP